MLASSSVLGVALLLLHLWGTHSFPTSACPVPCLCQHGPLLNCSSLGLTEIPTRIPATAVSLNISNNALRSLAPLSFGHSLRKLNTLVDVSFNRWKCDCNLQTLRRWISFDSEMGDSSWQVVCASPPHHGGKDLTYQYLIYMSIKKAVAQDHVGKQQPSWMSKKIQTHQAMILLYRKGASQNLSLPSASLSSLHLL
uniref:LRRNT domain-containing protein n=1 Tax=Sinocyclocheilus anshuiensis TaxID=1608454 RepID=A0A671NIS0_9TELE